MPAMPQGFTAPRIPLPTWERAVYRGSWRLALSVQRNPYRKMMWNIVRDDASMVRYWNFNILLSLGTRRYSWWHFVQVENPLT